MSLGPTGYWQQDFGQAPVPLRAPVSHIQMSRLGPVGASEYLVTVFLNLKKKHLFVALAGALTLPSKGIP